MPYQENYLRNYKKNFITTIKKLFAWIALGHFYKKNFFAAIKKIPRNYKNIFLETIQKIFSYFFWPRHSIKW